nr:TPA_asm: CC2 [Corynactis coral adintovirus]
MDIERIKKLSASKIEAGNITKQVRDTIEAYRHEKQDLDIGLAETFKPIVKAQKETKQSIDEKQDELIEQMRGDQKALTSGLENLLMLQYLPGVKPPEAIGQVVGPEPAVGPGPAVGPEPAVVDVDKGFDGAKVTELGLHLPSEVMSKLKDGSLDFDKYYNDIGKMIQDLGGQKGALASAKKKKAQYKGKIAELTGDIELLRGYRARISTVKEGLKMVGTGYTQSKRNAYKITKGGKYGNLIIDIPKLIGRLHLIATKGNQKVVDRKVDFDTIDLLTKRFNSRKKYSPLSRTVFDELNRLSEIPIHKSSKKFSKLGSGVIYYNDVNDLFDRMELLGGSIMAGNDGVKDEFSRIAHTLAGLGVVDNQQLIALLKEYVM